MNSMNLHNFLHFSPARPGQHMRTIALQPLDVCGDALEALINCTANGIDFLVGYRTE